MTNEQTWDTQESFSSPEERANVDLAAYENLVRELGGE